MVISAYNFNNPFHCTIWNSAQIFIKMKIKEFITGFKQGQKEFGETIAVIINSIFLTIVYFLGVGLTSIIAKISGKHFLDLKIDEKAETYWSGLNLTKKPLKEYYRQF